MARSVTYLLLFRGVGGATKLPVAPLREVLNKARFTNVTTYINSGNALVRSTLSREKTIAKVAKLCKEHIGFDKPIFAPTASEWQAVIDNNPFPEVTEGKHLHAALLTSTPKPEAVEAIRSIAMDGERLAIVNDVAYLHTPHGFGTSKFAAKSDKGIGVVNTARNWNTVLKMMELAQELEGGVIFSVGLSLSKRSSSMSFDTTAKVSLTIDQLIDLVDQLSDDDCRKLATKLERRGVAVRLRTVLGKLKGAKLDERTIRLATEKVRTRIHGEEKTAKGRR